MKKVLAAILCAGFLAAPCMACGRPDPYQRHHSPMKQPPRFERGYNGCNCTNTFYHNRNHRHGSTAALAAIAGVAGIAAIITAAAN